MISGIRRSDSDPAVEWAEFKAEQAIKNGRYIRHKPTGWLFAVEWMGGGGPGFDLEARLVNGPDEAKIEAAGKGAIGYFMAVGQGLPPGAPKRVMLSLRQAWVWMLVLFVAFLFLFGVLPSSGLDQKTIIGVTLEVGIFGAISLGLADAVISIIRWSRYEKQQRTASQEASQRPSAPLEPAC